MCGSALCGGKAYSILENFFAEYVLAVNNADETQYEIMNLLAQKAYRNKDGLKVVTLFEGTRKNPDERGQISNISSANFTPGNLILATLQGMVDELKDYFDCMNVDGITHLVASGNAIQKNNMLRKLLEDTFGYEICVTDGSEEAALGAALFSAVANKTITNNQAKNMIKYKR